MGVEDLPNRRILVSRSRKNGLQAIFGCTDVQEGGAANVPKARAEKDLKWMVLKDNADTYGAGSYWRMSTNTSVRLCSPSSNSSELSPSWRFPSDTTA